MMRRLVAIFLVGLFAAAAFADTDPNVRRGIAPENVYHRFDIDTVNDFTGNLSLRIPLFVAPAGPFMSESLLLAYNSSIYDYEFVEDFDPQTNKKYWRRAIPETFSNSGLGWTVSLGRLMLPRSSTPVMPGRGYVYRSSDGSEHEFDSSGATHDGSFLRLSSSTSTADPDERWKIEMPNGIIQTFDVNGELLEIRDRVGHVIEVDRIDATETRPKQWTIKSEYNSSTFRETTVTFEKRTAPSGYIYEPNFEWVVKTISVKAFNNGTANFTFIYEDKLFTRDGCGEQIPGDPTQFAAPVLTEVQFPEGLVYKFVYTPEPVGECSAGIVRAATLPTGGSIHWTYMGYARSLSSCDSFHGWVAESPGVETRTMKDEHGLVKGTWTYTTSINVQPGTAVACADGNYNFGPAPTEITTTVSAPDSSQTIRYFSGLLNGARATGLGGDYDTAEYGLAFTRDPRTNPKNPAAHDANRLLSSQFKNGSGDVIRTEYVTYEGDAQDFGGRVSNPRAQGHLVLYDRDSGCDGVCRVDTDRTDYDGYGHFRRAATTSNFGPTRTTFTNYTPSTSPWILGTYDSSWVEEGGVARKQLFTFDSNGVLRTRRTLVGTAATADLISTHATKDLLTAYCRDSRGFLTSERFFGGDGATALVPTGDPCAASPASTEYQIDHVFTFDANKAPMKHTAKYPGMPFFIADEDLDVNTGLVSTSRDVSGVATTFTYDALARPKEVRPTGTAWTLYEYTNASGTTVPAAVRVTMRPYNTSATSPPIIDRHVYYDWRGRPTQEKQKTPSDAGVKWATTNTVYDVFSRRTKVSVPEFRDSASYESTFVPAGFTTTAFDVLGRPTSVLGPDGKTQSISYAGHGPRKVSTTVQVALATGTANVTTANTYDAYGRLLEVEEPNGTKTRYSHGVTGLTTVCQNTTDEGATCGQTRTFTRDNRGFLTAEEHVENSETTYTYDARGHVLSRAITGDTQSEGNLKFIYDSAERLTDIQTQHPTLAGYRSGKVFTFGAENTGTGGANKKLGKPTSATRYNYNAGVLTVKETYDYDDIAGRLSKTTTEIRTDGAILQTLEQSQTYESGGNLGALTYPTCITVSCGFPAWNRSTLLYTNGFLTGVYRFADAISYTAAGAVSKVDHAGPVTDTYTADETAVRPKSITFSGQTSCFEPAIATGSPQDESVTSGQTATLTVSATGASGYQWYQGDGTKIDGATGSSYTTPSLTSTKTYYVEVYNDCRTMQSRTATVSICPQLSITTGTPQDQSIAPEQTATLTVSATGATAYQWYHGDGTIIPGQTSASFTTPTLTSTKTYYVVASNDCESLTSRTATVTVCPQLSITTGTPQDQSIAPEQTATLTVSASGANAYQWYEGNGTTIVGQTSASFTTPPLSTTTSYYVEVSNDCETLTSRTATVSVRNLPAPTGLVATANGTTSVSISWNASADADHYVLERKELGSAFGPIQNVYATSAIDSAVIANHTYVYHVRAVSPSETVSSYPSNADLSTTMVFTPLVAGQTIVAAAHFDELLAAVNAVRGASGTAAATWTSLLPAGVPAPAPGVVVQGQHLLSLRSAMNDARAALGFAALAYTDPVLTGVPIRVTHPNEIRGGVE